MDATQTENLREIKNAARKARVPQILHAINSVGIGNDPLLDHTTPVGRRMILADIAGIRELLDELETCLREATW